MFKMHPLKMRSRGGIALQEQFSLFAANFVRWAAVWRTDLDPEDGGPALNQTDTRFPWALSR